MSARRLTVLADLLTYPPGCVWLGLDGKRRGSGTRLSQDCQHDLGRPMRSGGTLQLSCLTPLNRSESVFSAANISSFLAMMVISRNVYPLG